MSLDRNTGFDANRGISGVEEIIVSEPEPPQEEAEPELLQEEAPMMQQFASSSIDPNDKNQLFSIILVAAGAGMLFWALSGDMK